MLQKLALLTNYNFNYSTSGSHHISGGALAAIFLVSIILYAVYVAALWQVFVKAGRPGWAAIVPIYNTWVLFEISGKPGWWSLVGIISVIPILGIVGGIAALVLYIIAILELAKRFGKSTAFAIFGMILFSIIGFLILGFGKDKYDAGAGGSSSAQDSKPKAPPTPTPPAPEPPKA